MRGEQLGKTNKKIHMLRLIVNYFIQTVKEQEAPTILYRRPKQSEQIGIVLNLQSRKQKFKKVCRGGHFIEYLNLSPTPSQADRQGPALASRVQMRSGLRKPLAKTQYRLRLTHAVASNDEGKIGRFTFQ